jgi:hypothetical protein
VLGTRLGFAKARPKKREREKTSTEKGYRGAEVYGAALHPSAIIVANALSIVLVATAILMKALVET